VLLVIAGDPPVMDKPFSKVLSANFIEFEMLKLAELKIVFSIIDPDDVCSFQPGLPVEKVTLE